MKDRFGEQLYDPACTCIRCAAMRPPRPHARGEFAEEVCIVCGADKNPDTQGDWCLSCIRDEEGAMR